MEIKCIIADMRGWRPDMARNVTSCTGASCVLINNPEDLTAKNVEAISPEYIFFPFWSKPIQKEIYDNYTCIIFHMTDVPFGRGGSPLQNLIVRGFTETKVSAIRCVEELDAGDVYLKHPLSLDGSAEEIYGRASEVIEKMIVEIIGKGMKPQPQQGEVVRFQRRQPSESNISGLGDLDKVFDYIRMLDADGYPHAYIDTDKLRLEFTKASRHRGAIYANVKIRIK